MNIESIHAKIDLHPTKIGVLHDLQKGDEVKGHIIRIEDEGEKMRLVVQVGAGNAKYECAFLVEKGACWEVGDSVQLKVSSVNKLGGGHSITFSLEQ